MLVRLPALWFNSILLWSPKSLFSQIYRGLKAKFISSSGVTVKLQSESDNIQKFLDNSRDLWDKNKDTWDPEVWNLMRPNLSACVRGEVANEHRLAIKKLDKDFKEFKLSNWGVEDLQAVQPSSSESSDEEKKLYLQLLQIELYINSLIYHTSTDENQVINAKIKLNKLLKDINEAPGSSNHPNKSSPALTALIEEVKLLVSCRSNAIESARFERLSSKLLSQSLIGVSMILFSAVQLHGLAITVGVLGLVRPALFFDAAALLIDVFRVGKLFLAKLFFASSNNYSREDNRFVSSVKSVSNGVSSSCRDAYNSLRSMFCGKPRGGNINRPSS